MKIYLLAAGLVCNSPTFQLRRLWLPPSSSFIQHLNLSCDLSRFCRCAFVKVMKKELHEARFTAALSGTLDEQKRNVSGVISEEGNLKVTVVVGLLKLELGPNSRWKPTLLNFSDPTMMLWNKLVADDAFTTSPYPRVCCFFLPFSRLSLIS